MSGDSEVVFVDSSILISYGRRESPRFQALAREARRRDTVFRLSPQVYSEVTGGPARDVYTSTGSAVEEALREGWLKVTESPSYTDSQVSAVMDDTREYIARASGRSPDIVETTDTEIVGLALEILLEGTAERVLVVTNDVPLGDAAESLVPNYGFDEHQIEWLTGAELADELAEDFVSEFE